MSCGQSVLAPEIIARSVLIEARIFPPRIPVLTKQDGKGRGYVIKKGSDSFHSVVQLYTQSGLAIAKTGFRKSKVEHGDVVTRALRKLFTQSLARLSIAPREILGLTHIFINPRRKVAPYTALGLFCAAS